LPGRRAIARSRYATWDVHGQTIRLKEQGVLGRPIPENYRLAPSFFKLEGQIFPAVPITPSEAVLGVPVEVPTLDGLVKMNIPSGSGPVNDALLIKATPMKTADVAIIEIQLVVPRNPSTKNENYTKVVALRPLTPVLTYLCNRWLSERM